MSNRINLSYSVPVQVIVNLDDKTVERVVVIDESITQDPGGYCADADTYEAINNPNDERVERAYKIAEDGAPWPSWDFGW